MRDIADQLLSSRNPKPLKGGLENRLYDHPQHLLKRDTEESTNREETLKHPKMGILKKSTTMLFSTYTSNERYSRSATFVKKPKTPKRGS
jgi:hypothetical protein